MATRKKTTRPYQGTRVGIEKSQLEIKKLLQKQGMLGVQFNDVFGQNRVIVRFAKQVQGQPRTVTVTMNINIRAKQKPEQAERETYRALYYWLKSQFEAIEFGITSFEEAFLAHFDWMLPTGQLSTVGQMLIPQITGKKDAPKLLPGGVIHGEIVN